MDAIVVYVNNEQVIMPEHFELPETTEELKEYPWADEIAHYAIEQNKGKLIPLTEENADTLDGNTDYVLTKDWDNEYYWMNVKDIHAEDLRMHWFCDYQLPLSYKGGTLDMGLEEPCIDDVLAELVKRDAINSYDPDNLPEYDDEYIYMDLTMNGLDCYYFEPFQIKGPYKKAPIS